MKVDLGEFPPKIHHHQARGNTGNLANLRDMCSVSALAETDLYGDKQRAANGRVFLVD